MLPDDPSFQLFRGLHYFDGVENLLRDIPIDLEFIRAWAVDSGLIFDPDQILNDERIADISKLCSPEDQLLIAIACIGEADSLIYLEQPYLPVRSLIRRQETVDLVFWKVTSFDVKFGFWIAGSTEEFCSESTAACILPKFADALDKLEDKYPVTTYVDGAREIKVEGAVRATFSKDGRSFDVELTHSDAA